MTVPRGKAPRFVPPSADPQWRIQDREVPMLSFRRLAPIAILPCLAAAALADPVAEGQAVARRWCAACHAMPDGAATDTAPSLQRIAASPGLTPASLTAWLSAPHPPMPDPGLSRDQIDAVIAYVVSLRP
jgi:mono/diheme cytochrome c family protein